MPQPDLALLVPRADFYRHAHPRPADVLLLIEVSDGTLHYDRNVKATAQPGITTLAACPASPST